LESAVRLGMRYPFRLLTIIVPLINNNCLIRFAKTRQVEGCRPALIFFVLRIWNGKKMPGIPAGKELKDRNFEVG
jgi:hypothetical protein